jgi:hypothetical protein
MHVNFECPLCHHAQADDLPTGPVRYEARCQRCAHPFLVYVCIYASGRPIVSTEARRAS